MTDVAATGPIIVWQDYGADGWKPTSFQTIREALLADRYGCQFVITRLADFEVVERVEPERSISEMARRVNAEFVPDEQKLKTFHAARTRQSE